MVPIAASADSPEIVLLVRGADDDALLVKLVKALEWYGLPATDDVLGRVLLLRGDLGLPRLGLDEATFMEVAQEGMRACMHAKRARGARKGESGGGRC